jgi:hypothetical protein
VEYVLEQEQRELNLFQLREVKYKGVVSAAMIYDNQPIIDHFRKVNDEVVAGVMDTKLMKGCGLYYFYLTKM